MIFCRAMELRNKERAKILSAKIQSNLSKRMSNYFASVSTSGEEFLSSKEYYLKIFKPLGNALYPFNDLKLIF